jgi:lysophospholipase L1-like esterase
MTAKLLLFAGFVLSMLLMSFNYGRKKRKILFLGDSITGQGLKFKGYITHISRLIKQDGLEEKYELIGAGRSGDKVYDLYLRLDEDVLAKGPDVVVIFIGVNDVWHKQTSGTGTDADKFVAFYTAIINRLKASGTKIVLCTPAVIGEKVDYKNWLETDLNNYSDVVRNLASQHNLPVVDVRKHFLEYNLINNPENLEAGILTTDGVHLNDRGNELVAEEMWKVIREIK